VEAVAELNDFVRAAARSFQNVRPRRSGWCCSTPVPVILPELPESLGRFAQDLLMKRGVEIRFDTRLQGATADAALLAGGERIATRTLVSTVPSGPNPLVAALAVSEGPGRIVPTRTSSCLDYPGVWAVGDCAHIIDGRTGQPARRPRSTPRARPAASPRTSWRACAGRRSARLRSRRWARWGRSGIARPSPRSSA
jgi:NADH dehydrogenase